MTNVGLNTFTITFQNTQADLTQLPLAITTPRTDTISIGTNAVQTLTFTALDPANGFALSSDSGTTGVIADNTIAIQAAGASESGNIVTIATSGPHGFTIGETVTISGVGVNGYNGNFLITSTPTSTTFTYVDSVVGLGVSGGGSANTLVSNIQSALDALYGAGNTAVAYTGAVGATSPTRPIP